MTHLTDTIIWRLSLLQLFDVFINAIIWRFLLLQLFDVFHFYNYLTSIWIKVFDVFYYCNHLTSFFYYNYWRFHQYYYLTSFISTMIWRLSLLQMVRSSYKETDRTQKSYPFYKLINGIVALTPKKIIKCVSYLLQSLVFSFLLENW